MDRIVFFFPSSFDASIRIQKQKGFFFLLLAQYLNEVKPFYNNIFEDNKLFPYGIIILLIPKKLLSLSLTQIRLFLCEYHQYSEIQKLKLSPRLFKTDSIHVSSFVLKRKKVENNIFYQIALLFFAITVKFRCNECLWLTS